MTRTDPTYYGCRACRAIYEFNVLFRSEEAANLEERCVACGSTKLQELSHIPHIIDTPTGCFLSDGCRKMGPYPDADAAQGDLWTWFNNEEKDGEEKEEGCRCEGPYRQKEGRRKGIRLVAAYGQRID